MQAGSWSYTGLDGKLYQVTFVADELGYRPVGGHIHHAHIQAQRQARRLAGKQITNRGGRRSRGQEERTRSQGVRTKRQEERTRGQGTRSESKELKIRGQSTRARIQEVRTRDQGVRTRG